MTGICIITNPHSKLNKRNPKRQELLSYVAGEKGQVKITQSLEELSLVAKDFSNRGIDILAINGGDGTISRTISTFIHAFGDKPLPPIVLLRGGTINMLAKNLKISGSPEQILFRLMTSYSLNQYKNKVRLPTLKIGDQYGFLFGNGSCYSFLDEFYKNKTGAIGSCLLLLKIIFSRLFSPNFYDRIIYSQKTELNVDNKVISNRDSCAVFCSVVEKMPLGKRLFFNLADSYGKYFEIVNIIVPARQAWYQLPWSVITKPRQDPKTREIHIAKSLVIKSENHSFFTLDGELFEPEGENLKIELGPELDFYIV